MTIDVNRLLDTMGEILSSGQTVYLYVSLGLFNVETAEQCLNETQKNLDGMFPGRCKIIVTDQIEGFSLKLSNKPIPELSLIGHEL